jgi:hypothetical protein
MVKTESAKFEIEKFNGKNNFEIWKVKMHDFLVQQGVVKALLGKAKKPVTITDEDWDEIDARALSAIRLCLVDDVLFNIVAEKTTVGLWTKLESLYMTKSLMNRIFMKRQLYSLCMKEGTKIVDHLNTFNTLLVQLTTMGVKFDSEDKAITLLCCLPMSWDHFVTSISFITTKSIEFDVIVGALLSEETRNKTNSKTSTSECWVCVIFFAQVAVVERLHRARRRVRGGAARPPLRGCRRAEPPRGGSGTAPPIFFFSGQHISGTTYFRDDIFLGPHDIRWFFDTLFFADGFLFSVKELGFWTNPGHWVRVLDVAVSYMYIVL